MNGFFQAIQELNPNYESRTVTVLTGPFAGEQAVLSDKNVFWRTDESGFISEHMEEIKALKGNGLRDISGTQVYTDIIGNQKRIVVCGAGHVSMPIIKIAKMIGFYVTVIDDRPVFAENGRQAGADEVVCDEFGPALDAITGDKDTFFIIVTRGHKWDVLCLRSILRKPHAYVGMMGSSRRVRMVKDQLKYEGFDPELAEEVHAPIGLPIEAETPEEIAVSIMSEIIQVKNRDKDILFPEELLEAVNGAHHSEPLPGRKILAVITQRKGSTPREVGTRMLLTEDGELVGTIGGGCAEGNVISEARLMFSEENPSPRSIRVDMFADEASEEGEVCGGSIDVWLQEV